MTQFFQYLNLIVTHVPSWFNAAILSLAVLALAMALYVSGNRAAWHRRHLDYVVGALTWAIWSHAGYLAIGFALACLLALFTYKTMQAALKFA